MSSLPTRSQNALRTAALALALLGLAAARPASAQPASKRAPVDDLQRLVVEVRALGDQPREIFVNGEGPVEVRSFGARRGYLGVRLVDCTPELRSHFGGPPDAGVLVSKVEADSPADRAGLQVGDLLLSLDGEPLTTSGQTASRIGRAEEGDEVVLSLVRDRSSREVRAVLTERERQQLDVGSFLWRCREDDEECEQLHLAESGPLRHVFEIDPDTIHEALGRLNSELGTPEWRERARRFQGSYEQIEERVRTLERRIRELEAQLDKSPE